MKRRYFMCTACVIGILLVSLQLCALRYLLRWVEEQRNVESQSFLRLVKEVTEVALSSGVPLFLSDLTILSRIKYTPPRTDEYCQIFCPNIGILHLATVTHLSTRSQRDSLVKELSSNPDLWLLQSKGTDRSLLRHGLEVTLPYHYFITSNAGHVIHISIFTERAGGVWWNCPVEEKVLQQITLSSALNFTKEIAFPKVEVHRAVVDGIRLYVPYPVTSLMDKGPTLFKECNYSRAASFFERYGKDVTKEAEEFQAKAWRLLSKATRLLDKLKVPFWLSSGTCLGSVASFHTARMLTLEYL